MKNYKKGFVIPLLIAIVALLGIGGGAYVYVNKKSAEKVENSFKEIAKNQVATTTNIVGNDRDEHGCIGSAGYSWCEAQNKCARVWEDCKILEETLPAKTNTPSNSVPTSGINAPTPVKVVAPTLGSSISKVATTTVSDGKGGTTTITSKILSVSEFNANTTKNIFQTFGSVTFNNGEYLIKEEANAGISAVVDVPKDFDGGVLTFNYKFDKATDGDYFVVYMKDLNDNSELTGYIGSNLQLARDNYLGGEASPIFESTKLQLIFILISRGEVNANLSIKDIKLKTGKEYVEDMTKAMNIKYNR